MPVSSLTAMVLVGLPFTVCLILAAGAEGVEWDRVQSLKKQYIRQMAEHAMEQQAGRRSEPIPIAFPANLETDGTFQVDKRSPEELEVSVVAAPWVRDGRPADILRFELPERIDMVGGHSGLAFTVRTERATSPEVRIGCRLIAANGKTADILPAVPVLSHWGDNPHEVYFDWAFINYANVRDAIEVLRGVEALEFMVAARQRTPHREPSDGPRKASFEISDLRVVDYLKGSYDPSRTNWDTADRPDLTLQHRTQECTGVVARFGGEEGLRSAVDSLDMCVRTQCWDGSFLDGRRGARTVVSGEYTHGFTLYGMVPGYKALEEAASPILDEQITVGPFTMTRREFYQRMFYRAAMSRGVLPTSKYRDDIIGGDTLMYGANRPEGFATAMRMIAEILTDPEQKKQVSRLHEEFVEYMVEAQGKYSGGFPLLGEGARYGERGIHYDAGYISSQMKRICAGLKAAPDPDMVTILDRYQEVFSACMDREGLGLVRLISERTGGSGPAMLSTPDTTAQIGLKYNLPVVAQWGYNCHERAWDGPADELRNTWVSFANARGYALGTFISVCLHDMDAEPKPRDLGYLFPRQFPVWSSRLYTKDGQLQRTSRMIVRPEGPQISDFWIEIGEYPETVGVPVLIESAEGEVEAVARSLSGWPKLLPEGAPIEISGDLSAKGKLGQTFEFELAKEAKVVVTGPKVALPPEAGGKKVPFRAEFSLTPQKPGQRVCLTVLRGTAAYELKFLPPHVLNGLPTGADLALERNGAAVRDVNRRARSANRLIDGDTDSLFIVQGLQGLSLRIELADRFPLGRIVLTQAQTGTDSQRRLARAREITVRPTDGEPIALTLEDRPLEDQSFDLGGVKADAVQIEVKSVYAADDAESDWGGFAEVAITKE